MFDWNYSILRNDMETKIVKEYKYADLGIDIILKDIVLYKMGREWLPKIDIEKLSKKNFFSSHL